MECESEVILDVNARALAGEQTSPRAKQFLMSRLTMALIAFTLFLATGVAVFLFSNAPVKVNLRHTLRQISNSRAAIHLEGKIKQQCVLTSVKWMNDVDQSHSQGGLELQNNEILIPRDGLYFVYSQASFRVSCSSRDADNITSKRMVHLSHTVKRCSSSFGNNNDKTILHSIRTACQNTASRDPDSVGSWFSAVYMGAVFHLKRGDRLKTVMEEKMLEKLEDEAGKTFFGVFAL
uniref:Tumor necrosis factor n=1 Tax=Fundulus heteroclitus TaxID=8078 RepID=A0A3Q2PTG3_FUNHE